MKKIEELINLACLKNKKISMLDILDANLTEKEYNEFILEAENQQIEIVDEYLDESKGIEDQEMDKENFDFYRVDSVEQYLKSISEIKCLTLEEERELFFEYKRTKDEKLREKLISANLRLVVTVARRYAWKIRGTSHELLDIIQEGNQGLMRAVEKFDVRLGNKFSTYAVWWIRQAIDRCITDTGKNIRIPNGLSYVYYKLKKYKKIMEERDNRIYSYLEIAEMLGIKEERATFALEQFERSYVSMNEPISDEREVCLVDIIQVEDDSLEDEVINSINYQLLTEIMKSKLTRREYFCVSCKMGIINEVNNLPGGKTLEAVGKQLGITREAVRQALGKAYRKIRDEYKRVLSQGEYLKVLKK